MLRVLFKKLYRFLSSAPDITDKYTKAIKDQVPIFLDFSNASEFLTLCGLKNIPEGLVASFKFSWNHSTWCVSIIYRNNALYYCNCNQYTTFNLKPLNLKELNQLATMRYTDPDFFWTFEAINRYTSDSKIIMSLILSHYREIILNNKTFVLFYKNG